MNSKWIEIFAAKVEKKYGTFYPHIPLNVTCRGDVN